MRNIIVAALLLLTAPAALAQGFLLFGYGQAGSVPSWVPNAGILPDVAINWLTNEAWTQTGGLTTPSALGVVTSRASVKQVVDSNGNWSQVAANVTAVGSGTGRSTEEARTNSIRNNSMVGAVVGTPGTLPTNWFGFQAGGTGLSSQIVGTSTIQGINYIDYRVFGTASASGNWQLQLEGGTITSALTGQVWSQSAFVALQSGSLTNITAVYLSSNEITSGGAFITNHNSIFTPASSLLRQGGQITLSGGGTTAFIQPFLIFNCNAGAVDVTLRIGWPQLELGASVTSPIVTSGSAATRAADVTVMPVTVGSAYTLFEAATPQAPIPSGLSQVTLQLDNGTDSQRTLMRRQANGSLLVGSIGGSGAFPNPSGTWTQNTSGTVAGAFAAGAQAGVFNGGTVATTSGASLPTTPTVLRFGSDNGGQSLDGLAAKDAIWLTQAIPNAQLQALQ